MRIFQSALLIATLLLAGSSAMAQDVEEGYASWYNRGFDGLPTASGEAYDHVGLTAAHPTIPFGTMVRITRIDTGVTIVARVNDRLETGPGHIIDVSGGAAQALGLIEDGVKRVRVEPVEPEKTVESARPVTEDLSGYTLQLGVFSTLKSAQLLASDIEGAWVHEVPSDDATLYRVYFQRFASEAPARDEQSRLWDAGYESFLRSL